jgi:septal ring factor EnvC (AmiA/AmiB activator)
MSSIATVTSAAKEETVNPLITSLMEENASLKDRLTVLERAFAENRAAQTQTLNTLRAELTANITRIDADVAKLNEKCKKLAYRTRMLQWNINAQDAGFNSSGRIMYFYGKAAADYSRVDEGIAKAGSQTWKLDGEL